MKRKASDIEIKRESPPSKKQKLTAKPSRINRKRVEVNPSCDSSSFTEESIHSGKDML